MYTASVDTTSPPVPPAPANPVTAALAADRYCGARTRIGGFCRRPAGCGTGHNHGRCKLHGGGSTTHGATSIRTTDVATQLLADHLAQVLRGEPAMKGRNRPFAGWWHS